MSKHTALYNNARWRRLRAAHLKANPFCVMCRRQGTVVAAAVCDHVEPHRGDVVKFWAGPFQSLCRTHHAAAKQREEHAGVQIGCGADGMPLDPWHAWSEQAAS